MKTKLVHAEDFPLEDTGVMRRVTAPTGEEIRTGIHVGARIAAARKNRGLNRNQLARNIGTSWALVDRWEKGRTIPNLDSLKRIAAELHVSTDNLLGRTGTALGTITSELAEFRRQHAPTDLTDAEMRWLSLCPIEPGLFQAEDFAKLLEQFRYQRARASKRREEALPL